MSAGAQSASKKELRQFQHLFKCGRALPRHLPRVLSEQLQLRERERYFAQSRGFIASGRSTMASCVSLAGFFSADLSSISKSQVALPTIQELLNKVCKNFVSLVFSLALLFHFTKRALDWNNVKELLVGYSTQNFKETEFQVAEKSFLHYISNKSLQIFLNLMVFIITLHAIS